jgi:predicted ATPase
MGIVLLCEVVITNIAIDNFKSLRGIDVRLPGLAYFCGPNASGKTNFAEAFDFLSNTFRNGLSYAVAEKGGFYNMCFRKHRRARGAISFAIKGSSRLRHIGLADVAYEISFSLRTQGEMIRSDFYVDSERYHFDFNQDGNINSSITIERKEGGYTLDYKQPEGAAKDAGVLLPWIGSAEQMFKVIRPSRNELIYSGALQAVVPTYIFPAVDDPRGMRVFRISTRIARQAGTPSVSGELGKHGENLASALDHMKLLDSVAFDRLQQWVRDVIPGLGSLRADYTETKQMGLFVQEKGFGDSWYADLSDGTLMSIALFLALLDSRYSCIVVEEPENSLHPWILRRFLEACKEMVPQKQILITTQSPIVVATASPDNLFLAERSGGVTRIVSAIEREPSLRAIINKQFLDLGEYWMSGGLGAVPSPPGDESDFESTAEE